MFKFRDHTHFLELTLYPSAVTKNSITTVKVETPKPKPIVAGGTGAPATK
jgi:hypothetical protein